MHILQCIDLRLTCKLEVPWIANRAARTPEQFKPFIDNRLDLFTGDEIAVLYTICSLTSYDFLREGL